MQFYNYSTQLQILHFCYFTDFRLNVHRVTCRASMKPSLVNGALVVLVVKLPVNLHNLHILILTF